MTITLEQTYALARAAQRVISAASAVTLTNNPASGLASDLANAVADLGTIVGAVSLPASGTLIPLVGTPGRPTVAISSGATGIEVRTGGEQAVVWSGETYPLLGATGYRTAEIDTSGGILNIRAII